LPAARGARAPPDALRIAVLPQVGLRTCEGELFSGRLPMLTHSGIVTRVLSLTVAGAVPDSPGQGFTGFPFHAMTIIVTAHLRRRQVCTAARTAVKLWAGR